MIHFEIEMKCIGLLLLLVVWAAGSVLAQNKALSLDRAGNYVQIPEGVWFNSDLTVEAWVYPTDLASWKLICCHWAGAVGKYHLGVTNGVPNMHVNTDKGTNNAASALALGVKEWYHVAGTYDGKNIKIYINGKLEGEKPHKGKMTTGSPWDVMVGTKGSREFRRSPSR